MSCPDNAHAWSYMGIVYSFTKYPLPGSGAYGRVYEDKFFCTRCLETQYINAREMGDSYQKPIPGSLPK